MSVQEAYEIGFPLVQRRIDNLVTRTQNWFRYEQPNLTAPFEFLLHFVYTSTQELSTVSTSVLKIFPV
jgi:hypothetical protein